MKPSQNIDQTHKLVAIVFMLFIAVLTMIRELGTEGSNSGSNLRVILWISIFILASLFIFFYPLLSKLLTERRLRKQHLNTGIFTEERNVELSLIDSAGLKALFTEEVVFRYLRKKTKQHTSEISVSGKLMFDTLKRTNCQEDPYTNGQQMAVKYSAGEEGQSPRSLRKVYDKHYYGYSLEISQSFMNDIECWNLEVKFFTECFKFLVIFPEERPPEYVQLKEISVNNEVEEQKEMITNKPIKKMRGKQEAYCVTLYYLDINSKYKIEWKWS